MLCPEDGHCRPDISPHIDPLLFTLTLLYSNPGILLPTAMFQTVIPFLADRPEILRTHQQPVQASCISPVDTPFQNITTAKGQAGLPVISSFSSRYGGTRADRNVTFPHCLNGLLAICTVTRPIPVCIHHALAGEPLRTTPALLPPRQRRPACD